MLFSDLQYLLMFMRIANIGYKYLVTYILLVRMNDASMNVNKNKTSLVIRCSLLLHIGKYAFFPI